ncbi:MAG: hypothetical protein KF791_05290 [Verrucomicrobiae bacterium]|nr:hypothetical protein [Verrucomicrobiae bacterium]
MKSLSKIVVVAAIAAAAVAVRADEGKEVKLTGEGMCAKCELKSADSCQNVVQVKDGDKKTTYYLTGDVSKAFHKNLCSTTAKVNVEGTCTKDGDKLVVAVTKIEAVK